MEDIRARFKDAPWFPRENEEIHCLIGGAGGIGSWLSVLLSRAGFIPIVYDYDIVESHNIGGQLFSKNDVGKTKVKALSDFIFNYSNIEIETFEEEYIAGTMTHPFVFAAFDNMKAREDMFNNWYEKYKDNSSALFMDGRLTMEQLQIICVKPENAEVYRKDYLFQDSEVEDAPCTLKQTSHTAAMIASLMVGFFTNHLSNIHYKNTARSVPLFHEYFIPINMVS